jgi:hypothetical protein
MLFMSYIFHYQSTNLLVYKYVLSWWLWMNIFVGPFLLRHFEERHSRCDRHRHPLLLLKSLRLMHTHYWFRYYSSSCQLRTNNIWLSSLSNTKKDTAYFVNTLNFSRAPDFPIIFLEIFM